MKGSSGRLRFPLFACALVLTSGGLVWAGSHTWDVVEVFSNASGTIQFIELREMGGGAGEVGVNGHNLTSGTRSYLIPGPARTPPTSFKSLLFATPAFAALPGAPTPDYTFPAGSVPFFSTAGDTVSYVPWDSYAFGAVPTDGVHSLAPGGVVACNTPKNYAGATATLNIGCTTPGDVDNSGTRDANDIAAFVRVKMGSPGGGDNPACAEYCTGSLASEVNAFVASLLS